MNFNPRHFLRMARWARNPPSATRVKLVIGVIVAALILVGLERIFGTPDWMMMDNVPRGRILR